jgi:hypothetical protein
LEVASIAIRVPKCVWEARRDLQVLRPHGFILRPLLVDAQYRAALRRKPLARRLLSPIVDVPPKEETTAPASLFDVDVFPKSYKPVHALTHTLRADRTFFIGEAMLN